MTTKVKVLFMGANPADSSLLGLAPEFRAVKKEIRASEFRDSLELDWEWAPRPEDLLSVLNQSRPHVVHFSGHGNSVGEILLVDANGDSSTVTSGAIKKLFENVKDNIRLVFLNACFSRIQAQAITEVIDCAIGMKAPIPDHAAIVFAASFYRAIGFGRSIQNAFNQGINELEMARMHERNIPELLVRPGVDANRIVLVGPSVASLRLDWNQLNENRHAQVGLPVIAASSAIAKKHSFPGTNPTGRSFLSYHRSRIEEARLLIAAQHDRGIPTWHDLNELHEEQTENEITRILSDSGTANTILWLTPELESDSLRHLEIRSILKRTCEPNGEDEFFACPVLAGGLKAEKFGMVLDSHISKELQQRKLHNADADPIGHAEAAEVAMRILKRRLTAIHQVLPEGESLRIKLFTRPSAVMTPGTALLLDWVDRFDRRFAKIGAWEQFLLPALRDVAEAVQTQAFERAIEVSGLASLPAATALGCVFLAPRGLQVAWRQPTLGRDDQLWSNYASREPSGYRAEISHGSSEARDLAVLVSVAANTEPAFNISRDSLPPFRAVIRVRKSEGHSSILESAGQARDVAQIVVEAIRTARTELTQIGCVHLFMAVPVGLAMMIGQLLNTLGSVQTYEHISDDGVGHYHPSVRLCPSG